MPQHDNLTANQKITNGSFPVSGPLTDFTTWTTQRNAGSGMCKVHLDDVELTQSDGQGGIVIRRFAYVDYKVGIYKRGFAAGPVASVVVRKYWGQDPGWKNIGNFGGGNYSIQTQLVAAYESNGERWPFQVALNPWVNGKFDIITG